MQSSSVRNVLLLVAVLYTLAITVGSLIQPVQFVEKPFNYFDKLLHAGAYFGLGILWLFFYLLRSIRVKTFKALLIIISLIILYGIIIEVLQGSLTTYRTADEWDIVANSIGAIGALLLVFIFKDKLEMLK